MENANPVEICCPKPLREATTITAGIGADVNIPKWKRFLDVGIILLAAPAWFPVMAVIAVLIKIVSPGSVFFTQERVGFRGSRFTCFKFRTMKANVETTTHENHLKELIGSNKPMTKMDNRGDSRLIPFARFIRATGLDELPQILNVLRGEMSLVGPRPCIPYEYDRYETWQKRRFDAVPGLTGLWQVSGKNKTTFNEMIELDVFYAQNSSFWFDVKIMLKTFPALINQVKEMKSKRAR